MLWICGNTVSRESAPSAENLDSPVTTDPSGNANCFLTMSQTFSTVSGLAWTTQYTKIYEIKKNYKYKLS